MYFDKSGFVLCRLKFKNETVLNGSSWFVSGPRFYRSNLEQKAQRASFDSDSKQLCCIRSVAKNLGSWMTRHKFNFLGGMLWKVQQVRKEEVEDFSSSYSRSKYGVKWSLDFPPVPSTAPLQQGS